MQSRRYVYVGAFDESHLWFEGLLVAGMSLEGHFLLQHLVDVCDPTRIFMKQSESDVLVKPLDMLMPFFTVEQFLHRLSLLLVEQCISTKAEITSTFAHDIF